MKDQNQPNPEKLSQTIPTATISNKPPHSQQQTEQRTVLFGLIGVLGLFFISWLSWPSTQAPEVHVTTPTQLQESPLFATSTKAIEEVTLQLISKPAGAYVIGFIAGEPFEADPTPSKLQVPKGATVEITFIASGYKPELKVFNAEKEQEVSATLTEQKKTSGRFGGFR
jgi:hypothetical protein